MLGAVAGWDVIWKRLQEPNPYALRKDFLLSSLEMVRDRPLTGFGLGTWSEVYPGFARFDDGLFANQAHNDWAQWAAEGGIPFFLLMLGVVGLTVRPALPVPLGPGTAGGVRALLDRLPHAAETGLGGLLLRAVGVIDTCQRGPSHVRP